MPRRLLAAALLASTLLASCAHTPPAADTAAKNREVVLAFYREALIGLQPRRAFERYVSPAFIEHKPDVEHGTRDATITYLEELIREVPEPRWEILKVVAEGDEVFLHARFTPAPGAPPYAIADRFRLVDGVIVEHWDVVAPPPKEQRNPNPRF